MVKKKKKSSRGSFEQATSPPLERRVEDQSMSLPYLGSSMSCPPSAAPAAPGRRTAAGPPTPMATARASPPPSTSRRPAVSIRPPAFRPVPDLAPGPATPRNRSPAASSVRSVAPKTRTAAPLVRPVAPPTARAGKPARPEAQLAPQHAAAPCAAAEWTSAAHQPLLHTPAAQPERPSASKYYVVEIPAFRPPARSASSPAPHSLLASPTAASPINQEVGEFFFSPPPPRGYAQDSPAVLPACLSRQGSDMSAYSGASNPRSRGEQHDALRDFDLDFLDAEPQQAYQPDARPQRRPRSSDGDAAEAAKRYCFDRELGSPTFAETLRSPPPPRAATSQHDQTPPAGSTPAPPQKKSSRYPPLVVEKMPDWAAHFKSLKGLLGRPPNARPYQGGIRFLPESEEEYRVLQRYLVDREKECGLSWFAYSPPAERSLKVAIRGLPADTEPADIEEELRQLGFQPEYVRNIKARGGRPGCIFFAVLKRTTGVFKIYDTTQFLLMRGVKVEAWRGRRGPAQCHRCQQFRHSSHRCHRPLACVRCGESHAARDCPRPRTEPATCANCTGNHPACDRRCPIFVREAQRRKAGTVAISLRQSQPVQPTRGPTTTDATEAPSASLMAQANRPTKRGNAPPKKKRKKKRGKAAAPPPPPRPAVPVTEAAKPRPHQSSQDAAATLRTAYRAAEAAVAATMPLQSQLPGSKREALSAAALNIVKEVAAACLCGGDLLPVALKGLSAILRLLAD